MLSDVSRREIAEAFHAAERDRRQMTAPSETHPGFDIDDAYAVQRYQLEQQLADGASLLGHKVGLTAKAMQDMLGVKEPDFGHLLDTMILPDGAAVRLADLCMPRVEPELAFVLDRPLRGQDTTIADVLEATEYVVAALEVIDSRVKDWRITLPDTIADNASCGRVVLGTDRVDPGDLDLRLTGCLLSVDDEIAETGASGAVLGNPAAAVAWLATTLGRRGVALGAGEVIMPGSCTKALPVAAGQSVKAEFAGVGTVTTRFE